MRTTIRPRREKNWNRIPSRGPSQPLIVCLHQVRSDGVLLTYVGLYNQFLAPGSPCELNIDHNLRNGLAGRMTRAVGDYESMVSGLQEVVPLFQAAQNSVFKLMSSVRSPTSVHTLYELNSSGRTPCPSSLRNQNTPLCFENITSTT